MDIKNDLILLSLLVGAGVNMTAYAWSIQEDHGTGALIRCVAGSTSTVRQSNGGWTVLSAGSNGKSGGQLAIIGQAAVCSCDPE